MNVRELTLALLDEYELDGKYVNLAISSHKLEGMGREEKKLVTSLLYTTVERKLTYDYYISSLTKKSVDKLDVHTLNILRLGLCQLIAFDSVPDYAAVNETVKLARNKGERAFVNGVLRSAARLKSGEGLPLPPKEKNISRYLSVKYSFPLWMTKHFIKNLGEEETEALYKAFNEVGYTDLTVNTVKTDRDSLIELFEGEGFAASKSDVSSLSVRIEGSVNPRLLPGFDDGLFFVQDSACALSIEALSPKPCDVVIDVCACPGGKSFAAALLMNNNGRIYSFDLHESKLSLISEGGDRLGLSSVDVRAVDATAPLPELFGKADKVICDVPCSGLGVLGKKSDLRYREQEGVLELPELQYTILEASAAYLKDGGTLLYSTCTLNPAENEEIVSRFLASHPEFSYEDFTVLSRASNEGMLYTYPHIDRTDGFFIAKLKKDNKNE